MRAAGHLDLAADLLSRHSQRSGDKDAELLIARVSLRIDQVCGLAPAEAQHECLKSDAVTFLDPEAGNSWERCHDGTAGFLNAAGRSVRQRGCKAHSSPGAWRDRAAGSRSCQRSGCGAGSHTAAAAGAGAQWSCRVSTLCAAAAERGSCRSHLEAEVAERHINRQHCTEQCTKLMVGLMCYGQAWHVTYRAPSSGAALLSGGGRRRIQSSRGS